MAYIIVKEKKIKVDVLSYYFDEEEKKWKAKIKTESNKKKNINAHLLLKN